jgi:Na+/H+-dicarboxylate symporter
MRRKKLRSTLWIEYLMVSAVALMIGLAVAVPVKPRVHGVSVSPTVKSVQWILEPKSIQYIIETKMDDDARNPGLDKGREES